MLEIRRPVGEVWRGERGGDASAPSVFFGAVCESRFGIWTSAQCDFGQGARAWQTAVMRKCSLPKINAAVYKRTTGEAQRMNGVHENCLQRICSCHRGVLRWRKSAQLLNYTTCLEGSKHSQGSGSVNVCTKGDLNQQKDTCWSKIIQLKNNPATRGFVLRQHKLNMISKREATPQGFHIRRRSTPSALWTRNL